MEKNQDVYNDVSTSVPDFVRDPAILPTLEREENWDADNFTTYVPNLDRDIVGGPVIGKSKKETKKFRQLERLRQQIGGKKKTGNKKLKTVLSFLLYK
ncbi:hypothetical protein JTB14_013787 [Gonioctena quinquepunctata]|nr:hypothetical protein JTB14_013787 [Gonioctena quinquepunctata]